MTSTFIHNTFSCEDIIDGGGGGGADETDTGAAAELFARLTLAKSSGSGDEAARSNSPNGGGTKKRGRAKSSTAAAEKEDVMLPNTNTTKAKRAIARKRSGAGAAVVGGGGGAEIAGCTSSALDSAISAVNATKSYAAVVVAAPTTENSAENKNPATKFSFAVCSDIEDDEDAEFTVACEEQSRAASLAHTDAYLKNLISKIGKDRAAKVCQVLCLEPPEKHIVAQEETAAAGPAIIPVAAAPQEIEQLSMQIKAKIGVRNGETVAAQFLECAKKVQQEESRILGPEDVPRVYNESMRAIAKSTEQQQQNEQSLAWRNLDDPTLAVLAGKEEEQKMAQFRARVGASSESEHQQRKAHIELTAKPPSQPPTASLDATTPAEGTEQARRIDDDLRRLTHEENVVMTSETEAMKRATSVAPAKIVQQQQQQFPPLHGDGATFKSPVDFAISMLGDSSALPNAGPTEAMTDILRRLRTALLNYQAIISTTPLSARSDRNLEAANLAAFSQRCEAYLQQCADDDNSLQPMLPMFREFLANIMLALPDFSSRNNMKQLLAELGTYTAQVTADVARNAANLQSTREDVHRDARSRSEQWQHLLDSVMTRSAIEQQQPQEDAAVDDLKSAAEQLERSVVEQMAHNVDPNSHALLQCLLSDNGLNHALLFAATQSLDADPKTTTPGTMKRINALLNQTAADEATAIDTLSVDLEIELCAVRRDLEQLGKSKPREQMTPEERGECELLEEISALAESKDRVKDLRRLLYRQKMRKESAMGLEVVSRSYVMSYFMREPLAEDGERQCVNGPLCRCMTTSVRFGAIPLRSKRQFICMEFLLPTQFTEFLNSGALPRANQPCYVCYVYQTTSLFATALSLRNESSEFLVLQPFAVTVDGADGYKRSMVWSATAANKRRGIVAPFPIYSAHNYVYVDVDVTPRSAGPGGEKKTLRGITESDALVFRAASGMTTGI